MTHLPPYLADLHRKALASGVQVVEQIEATIHQLEHLKAVHLASLSRIATRIARDEGHADHGEHVHRAVEAEVAVATRMPQSVVASQMGHADALLGDYPELGRVFSEGRVSLRHTEVVVDAGQIVADEAARAAYEAAVLPLALAMTPAQLRAHARRLAELHAERSIDERHSEARRRRGVRVVDLDDGMAQLIATLGAADAYAIRDRLSRIAHRARKGKGTANAPGGASERTPGQTQADVLVDLLLQGGGAKGGIGAEGGTGTEGSTGTDSGIAGGIAGRVQVTVPVFTLAGMTGEEAGPFAGPAELEGYGPIDTATARRIAGAASGWERVMTHPVSGAVLAVDRYRPSEDLRRALGARDQHCRFPGCTRRLDHCDIDHTVPAARGGPTSQENTGHLCRKHHTLKHFDFLNGRGWKAKQLPGGEYEWTSPLGRRYRDAPASRVRFMPSAQNVQGSQTSQGFRRVREPSGDPAWLSEQRLD